MPQDVPSPIDLRQMADAREWEAQAEHRPGRDEILSRFVDEAVRWAGQCSRILELGSGPGFLAQRLLTQIPDAQYVALDFSSAMHVLAGERLAAFGDRVTFAERSFKTETWTEGLPSPDIVVTNQAVHELRHKSYAEHLHRQVHGILKEGGIYLVSDHFCGDGGLNNDELFMTKAEQFEALSNAGFSGVERLLTSGSLALHLARTR